MKNSLLTIAVALLGLTAPAFAAAIPESAKIDQILADYWTKHNVKPNAPASDETLVRRLYLDIAGRVPTAEEAKAFIQSNDPQKRMKLIDKLLASDGYTSHMFNYFADLLRLTDNAKGRVTAEAYEEWLKKQLKENKPFDQFVRDLVTTDGGVWDSGAIGFYLRDENRLDHLAYTTQVFLGTQIVCAQCHNHPFDKWTQKDYYHLAGYTYGMDTRGNYIDQLKMGSKGGLSEADRKKIESMSKDERRKYLKQMQARNDSPQAKMDRQDMQEVRQAMQEVMKPLRYTSIKWNDQKSPPLPHDYKYTDAKPGDVLPAKTIFGHDAIPAGDETKLAAFAKWMTSPDNPRFTMVIANRMWKKAFGLGLIEPADEIMDSTAPSNGPLMEHLTQLMIDKKYSLKSFLRVLYNTDAYQRAATTHEVAPGDAYHFTGPLLRRMSAEQVWDSLATITHGNLDATVDDENVRLNQYLDDLQFFMTTIKDKGAEGLIEVAKKANAQNADNLKKMEELRKQAAAMKGSGDKTASQQLARQTQKLREEKSRDVLVALLGEERANDLRRGYGGGKKPDQPKRSAMNDKELMAKLMALPREERKKALKELQKSGSGMASLGSRASEQPSPARPGTFLRTFGQSDREEIDNSSREASVPQALSLMNGPLVESLTAPSSQLGQRLDSAGSAQAKLDEIYLAFLSRTPTNNERSALNQVFNERGSKAVADITHALLTGSQFLFVQ